MSISAHIIGDSLSDKGKRLTTFVLTYPRYIHAEVMTHRIFSRNGVSSRALTMERRLQDLKDNPVVPIFMQDEKTMEAKVKIEGIDKEIAQFVWDKAKDSAIIAATTLTTLGVHKQVATRLLEPFTTMKIILSGTDFDNFFKLRLAPDAQQEIQTLATLMKRAMEIHEPTILKNGEWHLPLLSNEEKDKLNISDAKKIASARVARVSYDNFSSKTDEDNIKLSERLLKSKHMSPFEHIATPLYEGNAQYSTRNFTGWVQYRAYLEE